MKTVFSNHAQCAHVWAQQTQSEGRSGPLYFYGPAIYSYGRHYCIARFTDAVTVTGARIVLFNATGSSATTQGKHKPAVRDALRGLNVRVIDVPNAEPAHAENLAYFRSEYDAAVLKAARAKSSGEWHLERAEEMRDTATVYAGAFGLELAPFPPVSPEVLATAKARASEAAKANREKEKRQREKDAAAYQEAAAKWRAGENVSLYGLGRWDAPTMLRRLGDRVQTSRGAEITLPDARLAWRLILSAKQAGGVSFSNGPRIGHFQLSDVSANGDATIGCHHLEFAELERMARELGFTEEGATA